MDLLKAAHPPHGTTLPETHADLSFRAGEQAGYLDHGGQQLYYVLHLPDRPVRAMALLAGPFASERPHSYTSWVRWARFLAASGIGAMRFDYRGVGESSGVFEEMTFDLWRLDIHACAQWIHRWFPDAPLALHGLGMGALLATEVFEQGIGDALLLWAPPSSGREVLSDALRRRLAIDYVRGVAHAGRESLIGELQAGRCIAVEGYRWSPKLWKSAEMPLKLPNSGESHRPWKAIELDRTAEPLIGSRGAWQTSLLKSHGKPPPFNPPHAELFNGSLAWIKRNLPCDSLETP